MQLISRVIRTGDLNNIIDWGITPEDFLTSEGRAMYSAIFGYYSRPDTSGSVIGPNTMIQIFPTFNLCDDTSMTTEALCLEVRKQRLAIDGKSKLDTINQLFDHDPVEALNKMSAASTDLLNIGIGKNSDMFLSNAFDNILRRYSLLESGVNMSCGPWPWGPIDNATGGFQHDDYIVFYGRPKSFKSWILAYVVAWLFELNKRVLIYTKEMTQDNIFMRVIACVAKINYQPFRLGHLNPIEKNALYATQSYMYAMQAQNNLVCLSGMDAPPGGDTVAWLRSKIEKYKPDFVAIDGMYLMSDMHNAVKDHERVRNISRDLRAMNLRLKIPVIATIQANRKAADHEEANLDEIAFSDGISQDATCIMRVINEKDSQTCQLILGGAREYALNGFRINAMPATDFSFNSLITAKEIIKAKQHDSEPEDNPKAHIAGSKSNGNGKSHTEAANVKALLKTMRKL